MEHTYWQKRYGHGPRVLTADQMVMQLVRDEGVPEWAARSLVSLAASRCTLLCTFEPATLARSKINEEFYVTARTQTIGEMMGDEPQKNLQLENLESRNHGS